MPKLVDVPGNSCLCRIVFSPFESKILKAIRTAKKEKNSHKVRTLEKMIDYGEIYREIDKLK